MSSIGPLYQRADSFYELEKISRLITSYLPVDEASSREICTLEELLPSIISGAQSRNPSNCNFLRRISDDEWEVIEKEINALESRVLTPAVIEAFQTGKWEDPIFQSAKWIYFAMASYCSGHLDEYQASRLFLYYGCLEEAKKAHALFSRERDQKLRNEICPHQTDQDFSNFFRVCCLKNRDGTPNEEGIKLFNEGIKLPFKDEELDLSPEESQFFLLTTRLDGITNQTLKVRYHFQTFFSKNFFPDWHRMKVFPPKLHEALLNLCPAPIKLRPGVGYSTKERLSDIRQRVVAIPFPNVKRVSEIHGEQCTWAGIFYHDLYYHAVIESFNIHRPLFEEVAQEIASQLKKSSCPAPLKKALGHARDRDFAIYIHPYISESLKFWFCLLRRVFETATTLGPGFNPIADEQNALAEETLAPLLGRRSKEWGKKFKLMPPDATYVDFDRYFGWGVNFINNLKNRGYDKEAPAI